jgi:hypothetical protein
MRRDGPFGGLEYEDSTKFLRSHYLSLKKAGLAVEPSFDAWARANGFIVASNHGWDDSRRRRVHYLGTLLDAQDDSATRSAGPGKLSAEAQMRPIAYGGKRRPRRRKPRPQTP